MAGEIGDYCGIDFIGGGLGAVDKIDGAVLQDKDHFLVVTPTVFAPLSLDADSGAGESSPQIIAPNTNPGTKRWVLTGGVFAGLTLYGNVVMPDGGTIGQAAGPLLTFDDTNNFLDITGCDVVIGGAIARTKLHVITTNVSAIDWSTMINNIWAAEDMSGTGVGLKLKTYSDSQVEQNLNKWTGIASESQATPTYGKRVDQVFYTVANAETAAPTEKMRITGAGLVGIGTPTPISTVGGLDISSGGLSLVIGANPLDSARTNALGKDGRFGCIHYTNAEEPLGIILAQSTETTGVINIGGGSALFNAATEIRFYTAANNVTPMGTLRGTFNSAGDFNLTGSLKVDDIQVVSNQGAAVANATDPATTMARLNDLLARCRAHGLIAT